VKFYTYIYYDPDRNNEPFYVGKGLWDRIWSHFTRRDKHPVTNRVSLIKRNNRIPIVGIYAGLTEIESLDLEIQLIKDIGRKDLGKGPLLNLTDGGESGTHNKGRKRSEKTRKKMSESAKKRIRTDEMKEKIRQTQKSKPPRAEHIRKKISEGMKNSTKRIGRPPKDK
jgi:hypothetical protein